MGLDVVELVMRAEEEFGVELGDAECERVETCGQFCALIESKLRLLPLATGVCPTSAAFYQVRREILRVSGTTRQQIGPKSLLDAVLPQRNRRENWRKIETALGLRETPLVRPNALLLALNSSSFLLFGASLFLLANDGWGFFFSSMLSFCLTGTYWCITFSATQALAAEMPPRLQTVGALALRVAALSPTQPSRDIWPHLREMVADEFSIPLEKVTREAHFVRDLGVG